MNYSPHICSFVFSRARTCQTGRGANSASRKNCSSWGVTSWGCTTRLIMPLRPNSGQPSFNNASQTNVWHPWVNVSVVTLSHSNVGQCNSLFTAVRAEGVGIFQRLSSLTEGTNFERLLGQLERLPRQRRGERSDGQYCQARATFARLFTVCYCHSLLTSCGFGSEAQL